MALLNLNTELITEKTLRELSDNTNITYLSPGSKARLLLDIINDKLGIQADQFDKNLGQAFIRNASGTLLDYIGEIFGVQRELKQKAEVLKEEGNFYFYTLKNNFGAINNSEDIYIRPRQVEIYDTIEDGKRRVVYVNTETIVLKADKNKVFFSAEAKETGENSNVGSGTMIYHNFKNYADILNQTLLVNNAVSVTYGKNDESDDNYRFRIQQQTIAGEAGNYSAIRLALLSVAGIADVVRVKYPRGVGTSDWLIRSVTPEVPEKQLDLAQQAIEKVEAAGLENKAAAPYSVGTKLEFSLSYIGELKDEEKNLIKRAVKRKLVEYINNLNIGDALILDQLVRIVLTTDERIESMGDPNSISNFKRITLFKRSKYGNSIIKRTISKDYITKYNERIIVEPTITDPIIIGDN